MKSELYLLIITLLLLPVFSFAQESFAKHFAEQIQPDVNPLAESRKGIIMGISIGGGISNVSWENQGIEGIVSKGVFGLIFRIGYAPNDIWQIYATYRYYTFATHLGSNLDEIADGKDWRYVGLIPASPIIAMFSGQHMVIGLGTSYFLKKKCAILVH